MGSVLGKLSFSVGESKIGFKCHPPSTPCICSVQLLTELGPCGHQGYPSIPPSSLYLIMLLTSGSSQMLHRFFWMGMDSKIMSLSGANSHPHLHRLGSVRGDSPGIGPGLLVAMGAHSSYFSLLVSFSQNWNMWVLLNSSRGKRNAWCFGKN